MQHDPIDIAIIGAGGAGTMAYLRAVLNGGRAALFLGDAESKRKGRATWVLEVDNIPGMHDLKRPITQTTKSTLKWIEAQEGLGEGCRVIPARVERLERVEDGFRLSWTVKGEEHTLDARFVVVTTGIMDVQPEIGGSIQPILPFANRGDAIYCIRCDGHQTRGKKLALIGNSDTAVHIAAMMIERYGHEHVDVLTNGVEVEFSDGARQLLDAYPMSLRTEPITEVLGDPRKDGLAGFVLEGGETIEAERAIVALGILAYNELLASVGAELDAQGKAVVGPKYETSVPGLFVAGDLVSGRKMQIYTGWDGAVDALDEVDRRLRMERRAARLGRA